MKREETTEAIREGAMTLDFPRRTNPDGTTDSTCQHCYVTIGKSHWEADLDQMEAVHECEPASLWYYEERESTFSL